MANSNFVVKNGLTVGALTIDAATGNITTSGTISGNLSTTSIAKNDTSLALNDTGTGSDVAVTIDGTEIFTITGSGIIPSVNSNGTTGFSLGSPSFAWKDVYVSSGSLYVNGQKVLQDDSGTIVVSADANQNLSLQTSGAGNVELDPTGSGAIQLKGTVQVLAGKNITSSDGNAITFSNSIDVDAIESRSTDTDLTLTANGTGKVYINDNLTVTGSISGTGATVSFADNIVDLNADFTSGAPTENGGIRILRGDNNAATLLYNETSDVWQIFDGTNTHDIVGADDTQTLTNKTLGATTIAGTLTPSTTETYDLGTSSARFRDIYLSGTTIDLGGSKLSKDANGDLEIKDSGGNLKKVRSNSFEVGSGSGSSRVKQNNSGGRMQFTDGSDASTGIEVKDIAKGGTSGTGDIGGSSSRFGTVYSAAADMSGNLAVGGDATITGNLTVNGTTTTVATTNTVVSDSIIELNNGATSNGTNDLGIVMERGSTGDNAFMGWDESADAFIMGTTTATGASTGGLTITKGTLQANLTGDVTGNATTASAWATARTLSLTGAVTGSVSIDGSGNVSLATTATSDPVITLTGDVTGSGTMTNLGNVSFATTIAANSVALGTDTTGNYVATGATSGNGISGSVSSEGGTFTVTSNATSANTASTIVFRDASGNFSAGTMTGTSTQAQYADLAENYVGDMKYEAGTVVEFGGAEEVTKAAPGSPRIAGVVSTAPGFLMNTGLTGATVVAVAYTGRVPTKISGPCRKGDIMVAGPNGTATRATSEPKAGMIIGKALANFDGNSGVIEIAVGR